MRDLLCRLNLPSSRRPTTEARSSLNERFLLAVRPEAASVSIGRSFFDKGFPDEMTGFLEGMGAKVYNTHESGAIVLNTDGTGYRIETYEERELKPASGPWQELENYRRLSIVP